MDEYNHIMHKGYANLYVLVLWLGVVTQPSRLEIRTPHPDVAAERTQVYQKQTTNGVIQL